jgi:hypothetical protein
MNKSYRFVESNSGKSNVTILSLFQALPDIFVKHSFEKKEYRNQNEKISFFSNNYWFSCYCRFFSLAPDGVVFAGFLLFAIILFSPAVCFPLLTLVFFCFFFRVDQSGLNFLAP